MEFLSDLLEYWQLRRKYRRLKRENILLLAQCGINDDSYVRSQIRGVLWGDMMLCWRFPKDSTKDFDRYRYSVECYELKLGGSYGTYLIAQYFKNELPNDPINLVPHLDLAQTYTEIERILNFRRTTQTKELLQKLKP